MSGSMRKDWLIKAIVAAIALVLAYAWIDGGREPIRKLSETVALPEVAK